MIKLLSEKNSSVNKDLLQEASNEMLEDVEYLPQKPKVRNIVIKREYEKIKIKK